MNKILFDSDIKSLFPKKSSDSHKGTYGTLVICGGSQSYVGAPYLSYLGASALRTGTGIVRLAVPRSLLPALQQRVTENTLFPLHEIDGHIAYNENQLHEAFSGATAVLFGMGIGNNKDMLKILAWLVENLIVPLLLDADALNILSLDENILNHKQCPIIITPHIGEMARLTKLSTEYIKKNKTSVAHEFAKKHNIVVLLKDNESVITNGIDVFSNMTGTPAMAKGGSGDLLSGIIGGLLARKIDTLFSAAAGAYIAGRAAEKALTHSNEYSLLPSESALCVSDVISEILS